MSGLRVVDITTSVAGPFATQILGDLGADVIKVEQPPLGDVARRWGPPFWGPDSATFQGLNRNKRSLLLDIKSADGPCVLTDLLAGADVMVQNLRPGALATLGFGYETVHELNPRLIYCEITGYGATGPLAAQPAYDPLMQAFSGLMSLNGDEAGPPARVPSPVLDQGSGMWAVIGILDALRRRDATGSGALVQTSLLQTALMWLPPHWMGYFAEGVVPPRLGSGAVGIAPYQAFAASDGWIIVAAGNDGLWQQLCGAIGRRDLLAEARYATNPERVKHRRELAADLSVTFATKSCAQWVALLTSAGVPATPIATMPEVAAHPQVAAIGAFQPVAHPDLEDFRLINTPVQVDGSYYPIRLAPPRLGEGGDSVLAELAARRPAGPLTAARPPVPRPPRSYPSVTVIEEGMREGFQIESAEISVADKLRLLDALSRTGLRRIVVGSFVSPRWTPQMARIDELVERMTPTPDVVYTALALNERGRERMAAHIPPLSWASELPETLVHLCDVFARRNTGRSQQDEIQAWAGTVGGAALRGAREAGIGVNAAWGSNWLGDFSLDQRMDMLCRQHQLWSARGIAVTKVFLGDPMGWNMPDQVEEQLAEIMRTWPDIATFHLHLHNTRGTSPVSVYAALRTLGPEHMLILDSAVGGMGGCPYCGNGRAAGLMPTEDLIYLLEELGIGTGVDLDRLIEAVIVAEDIVGHPLYGHVSKAGPRPRGDMLYPMDMPFVETLAQAQHFRLGPDAYAGALSPWREPITSPFRPSDGQIPPA
jgi:hydroxymethylglutaryl-CoA lyase